MESLSPEPHSAITERQLLRSVVALARYVYAAAAASVFMVSQDGTRLVFAAVAGAGEETLVGTGLDAGTGIAGWVVASGQTLIADNVEENDQFARDVAASTGYLPVSIMAAPLVADGECIGVLEVLDRHTEPDTDPGRDLDDVELLGLLATQAALSLALLRRSAAGGPERPLGPLLGRLSDHAARNSHDPLATALLGVSLDLLDRNSAPSSR